jgi:hypothetical protein
VPNGVPEGERGQLRIASQGGWPVGDTIEFLDAFKSAYQGILVFEMVLESYTAQSEAWRRYAPFPPPFYSNLQWATAFLHISDEELSRLIRPRDQLVLRHVELSSPGFWEFLGALNPLDVLRKYLDDRHRRRQDREYREREEARTLDLENQLRENEVIRGRIEIARELGLSDQELAALFNRLVHEPVRKIDVVEARGMILPGTDARGSSE